jgi:hypothetical protein
VDNTFFDFTINDNIKLTEWGNFSVMMAINASRAHVAGLELVLLHNEDSHFEF